jgi:hypothetical protein
MTDSTPEPKPSAKKVPHGIINKKQEKSVTLAEKVANAAVKAAKPAKK